jgi:hypothetical protein
MRRFHSYGPVDQDILLCPPDRFDTTMPESAHWASGKKRPLFHHLGTQANRKDMADTAGQLANRSGVPRPIYRRDDVHAGNHSFTRRPARSVSQPSGLSD